MTCKIAPATSRKSLNIDACCTNDFVRMMAEILVVTTQEFSARGLAGARNDEIAERTRTSERMISYYFVSK